MKKRKLFHFCLLALLVLCSLEMKAQVGIGTDNPTNTLHIIPMDSNEDPLKIENLNQSIQNDSAFLVIDPINGIVRYLPKDSLFSYLSMTIDQSNTNELQDASNVPLSPNLDVLKDGVVVTNVQEAIEALASKVPKGTFKSIAEARSSGLVNGDSFYTHPKGVFGCSGCIITLFEGM